MQVQYQENSKIIKIGNVESKLAWVNAENMSIQQDSVT